MTIEEKAKAYDKAIEKIKYVMEHGVSPVLNKEDLQDIFPELAESEDEKIRKALLEYFGEECDTATINGIYCYKIYDWLEKQSEQKVGYTTLVETGNGGINALVTKELPTNDCDDEHNLADKIERKFKVGDWITDGYLHCKISDVLDDRYIVDTKFAKRSAIPFKCEHNYHLWTIADAKDGDVLAYVTDEEDLWIMIYWSLYEPYEGHVHYHALLVNKDFTSEGTCCIDIDELKPATKEQREMLFKAMADAGYEWDAEKKELKKIENSPILSNSLNTGKKSWSEEDEELMQHCCGAIAAADYYTLEDKEEMENWLKSLKKRMEE